MGLTGENGDSVLQTILLSFNAVSALIPVMLIGALILAAAGLSRGKSLFDVFSIGVILNTGKGAGSGAAGKGLKKRKLGQIKTKRKLSKTIKGVPNATTMLKGKIKEAKELRKNISTGKNSPLFIVSRGSATTAAKTAGMAATMGAGYAVASKAGVVKGRVPTKTPTVLKDLVQRAKGTSRTSEEISIDDAIRNLNGAAAEAKRDALAKGLTVLAAEIAAKNTTDTEILQRAKKTGAKTLDDVQKEVSEDQAQPAKVKLQSPLFARHNQIKRVKQLLQRAEEVSRTKGEMSIDDVISNLNSTADVAKRDALAKGLTVLAAEIAAKNTTDTEILEGAKDAKMKTLGDVHKRLEQFSKASKQLSAGYRKLQETSSKGKSIDAIRASKEIADSIDAVSDIGVALKIFDKDDTTDLKRHMIGKMNQIQHPFARLTAKNIALRKYKKLE